MPRRWSDADKPCSVSVGQDEALASFEAALRASPELADVRRRVEVLKFRAVQDRLDEARRAVAAGQLDLARAAYQQAIAASPESSLLYRELAAVEQKQGRLDLALVDARRAVDADRSDLRAWTLLGEVLEASGDLGGAIDAFTSAAAVEPSEALDRRIAALRSRAELARMPAEYRAIAGAAHISRGDLAALLGARLGEVLGQATGPDGVVITDVRNHWAARWIRDVVRAGVMEIYANHTFEPAASVSRGDLAQAVGRVLDLIARANPGAARPWQDARMPMADLAPEHLNYPAASAAVASGVMPLLAGDTFRLARPVAGAEAVSTVDRLAQLSSVGRPAARTALITT